MCLKILFLIAIAQLVNSEYVDYKNHKVYKVIPHSDRDVNVLVELHKKHEYIFWHNYEYIKVGREVKIQVTPEQQEVFMEKFSKLGIEVLQVVDDVQSLIEAQRQRPAGSSRNIRDYAWDHYQTLEEIYDWMEATAAAYPGVAEIITIGNTIEGRPIKGMVIDHRRSSNPVFGFIEGGLHAREWISPATVTWIIKEFLTSNDPGVRAMAHDVVWHIVPVTNPDGYVYSFTDNRMWRKNRNPLDARSCAHLNISDDNSVGIDLNRNFGYLWNKFENNTDPCTIVYPGPIAFSELEALSIANHINGLKSRGTVLYYLSYHSFMQMLLLPHSHTGAGDVRLVPHYGDLYEIGARGMAALTARHNTPYSVGTVPDLFPGARASGLGFDWAKGAANITMSFLFESRDDGAYGFLLPPHNIIPNNEETMDGMAEMHRFVIRLGYLHTSAANSLVTSLTIVIASMMTMILVR